MVLRQDLDRLSWAAGHAIGGVEPLVLRIKADLFASARPRDAAAVSEFETLALPLLPKVDEATARYVADRVAHLPETPGSVLAALSERNVATPPDVDARRFSALLARDEPAIDLRVASDPGVILHARPLQLLVDRARNRPDLARALLARDDLPASEAIRLYQHADRNQRARLREAYAASSATRRRSAAFARPSGEVVAGLVEAADARDGSRFGERLKDALGLARRPVWRFDQPDRHEFLALALKSAGLREEDCIRIFLTLEPRIACSVTEVFVLVELIRTVPRSIAIGILEAALDVEVAMRPRNAAASDTAARPRPERASLLGRIGLAHEKGREDVAAPDRLSGNA